MPQRPVRRVRTLEERREALTRRSDLAVLTQLPNWEVFSAVIETEIESVQRTILARVLGVGMTPEEQAYERGRIAGMRYARSVPERERRKVANEEVAGE